MKTALVIPGLDAIFSSKKLQRWLEFDYIQESLSKTSKYLSKITKQQENLNIFLEINKRPHLKDFDRTLVALTAIQLGIITGLIKNNMKWDIVLGCSHGDIARSVHTGILTLERAVEVLWSFAYLRKNCPPGYTVTIRPIEKNKQLSTEQINWLERSGLLLSHWSETHATAGSDIKILKYIEEHSIEHGLKVTQILPYPVHSPVMQSAVDFLKNQVSTFKFNIPNTPVYSSVNLEYITSVEQAIEEGLSSAVKPVLWIDTIKKLNNEEHVSTFINVGPSNTLTGWMLNHESLQESKLIDAWDILGKNND